MKRILLIESSGGLGQVALAEEHGPLRERQLDQTQRHARDLAPAIRQLLAEENWPIHSLSAVAVSLGPGSYTGLRVGVISAKTLAYALGCPLVGIATFEILASRALASHPSHSGVEVIEDAQQDRVYTQRFARGPGGHAAAIGPLRVLEHAEWLAQLEPRFPLLGPGLHKKHEQLPSQQPVLRGEFWRPSLTTQAELAWRRLEENRVDSPFELEPIYGRATAAERQWAALGR